MTTEQKIQFIIEKAIEANPSIKDRNSRTLENGMVETCFCAPKISLEDILMALNKKDKQDEMGVWCISSYGRLFFRRRGKVTKTDAVWILGKPLTSQSEELKNFVYEILK